MDQAYLRILVVVLVLGAGASAGTVAYWRFEAGPANTNVPHVGAAGAFYAGVADVSGNGNHLSVWDSTQNRAAVYRTNVPVSVIRSTGEANTLSIQNGGSNPGLFTGSAVSNPPGIDLQTITPEQWTIEAAIRPDIVNNAHRTFVGRDGSGVVPGTWALAPLYFVITPNAALAIRYADVDGRWHDLTSSNGLLTAGTWYRVAAVSTGSHLRLYVDGANVASMNLPTSGSTAIAKASDDHPWTVGRGMFNGNQTDWFIGHIDEVRISDSALAPQDFLLPTVRVLANPSTVQVAEGGPSTPVGISLSFPPTASVRVDLFDLAATDQVYLSVDHLDFNESDWDAAKFVHVLAVNDDRPEDAWHSTMLGASCTSDDELYDGLAADAVTISIADNDCGGWGFLDADLNRDCTVDLLDLALLGQSWLQCTLPSPGCANYR